MKFKQLSLSIGMKYSKYFTLLLAEDGTVWGTGSNYFGQLGTGNREDCLSPAMASGLQNVISVEAGNLHSVALTEDGKVYGFGLNIKNTLGSLPPGPNPVPRLIPELEDMKIQAVAAAGDFTFALSNDSLLYIFGDGKPRVLEGIESVYAGANESCVRKTDGSFVLIENGKEPVPLPGQEALDVSYVSAGNTHMTVLTRDGAVFCRGDNSNGQLGLEDAEFSGEFVDMKLTGIKSIASGGSHTLALNDQGEVYAWGFNFFGLLGDGTGERRLIPQKVEGLPPVRSIACGTFNSMVIAENGEIYGWGSDDFGQLGDLSRSQIRTPRLIEGISNVKAARAGLYHTAVLSNDGRMYIAGCNLYGQLGDGRNDIGRHTMVPLMDGISELEAGGTHTVAMDNHGKIWAWGNNACGQIGNGRTDVNPDGKLGGGERRNEPFPTLLDIPSMKSMAAGENHTLFLDSEGYVYAVGLNNCGQLGDGTRHNTSTPFKIEGLEDIKEIHAHKFRSAALSNEGKLYCWGYNGNGELGTGDTEPLLTPRLIMENVSKIVMGGWYTIVIKEDSSVWAFGMNADGQFGNGTNKGCLSPVEVTEHYGAFADIKAGGFHTVILRPDGTVWTCGKNEFGELGGGTSQSRFSFSPVSGLKDIVKISAGWFCVFALSEKGELYSFGRNNFGQLCHGDTNRYRPVKLQMREGL